MSEVRLVIRDWKRDITGTIHGGSIERIVAALSFEPESIEELDQATERFQRRSSLGCFAGFEVGCDDTPWDAGIIVIDLSARLIVYQSTYSTIGSEGHVFYHDGEKLTNFRIAYTIPEDWLIANEIDSWRFLAKDRRDWRQALPKIETREILFGAPLLDYLTTECYEKSELRELIIEVAKDFTDELRAWRQATLCSNPKHESMLLEAVTEIMADSRLRRKLLKIHEQWLVTERADLDFRSPRQILLDGHDFIAADLQDRVDQWASSHNPPPTLSKESYAYRYAGFGMHQVIVYYDLIQHLIYSSIERLLREHVQGGMRKRPSASDRRWLQENFDYWMSTPNEQYEGWAPTSVADNERIRLPLISPEGREVLDCDCPLCVMMASDGNPVFICLDGYHMSQRFAFSLYHTREEWQFELSAFYDEEDEDDDENYDDDDDDDFDDADEGKKKGAKSTSKPVAGNQSSRGARELPSSHLSRRAQEGDTRMVSIQGSLALPPDGIPGSGSLPNLGNIRFMPIGPMRGDQLPPPFSPRKFSEKRADSDSNQAEEDASKLTPYLMLFGVGTLLADINGALKALGPDRTWIEQLNRCFSNLNDVIRSPDCDALLEPVIERLKETLDNLGNAIPEMRTRANLTHNCLNEIWALCHGQIDFDSNSGSVS